MVLSQCLFNSIQFNFLITQKYKMMANPLCMQSELVLPVKQK